MGTGLVLRQPLRILVLGSTGSGKTHLLRTLALTPILHRSHKGGFSVETAATRGDVAFEAWSFADPATRCIREAISLRSSLKEVNCIVLLVDCVDPDRIAQGDELLQEVLRERDLQDLPILILANKQDCDRAMGALDVATHMGLGGLKGRRWCLQSSSAKTGDGLCDGLGWLAREVARSTPPCNPENACVRHRTVCARSAKPPGLSGRLRSMISLTPRHSVHTPRCS